MAFQLANAQVAAITAAALVPYTTEGFLSANATAANAALAKAIRCSQVSAAAGSTSQATCSLGRVPAGYYVLMVALRSGVTLLSSSPLTVQLAVSEVQPKLGSIAGGTALKIAGGFQVAAAAPWWSVQRGL